MVSPRLRFVATSALVAAGLVTIASIAGLALPATYARETAPWRAQAIGQDWTNLVVVVPWLVATATLALRGSPRARLLLGGGLAYTAYSYAIYALDVHFNGVFLIYCGALGLAAHGLVLLATELGDVRDGRAHRAEAGLVMTCAALFAALWLAQIIGALLGRHDPDGLDAAGLPTNPVHVLDLALVLPAMFAAGWQLWRRRPAGYAAVPIALAFMVLMGAALVGMAIATRAHVVVVAMLALVAIASVALVGMMRPARWRRARSEVLW